MVKINQAQTPVGSIQGGVLLSRVNTNPDDVMMKTTLSGNGSFKSLNL